MTFNCITRGITVILASIVVYGTSCKKLIDAGSPITNITGQNVYTNNGTAAAVLTGIYTNMSSYPITGGEMTSIGFITGLTADEIALYKAVADIRLASYYKNAQTSRFMNNDYPWTMIYAKLYIINSAIEGVSKSTALTQMVKDQLLGEAKFMRAFCYFYLVNLYGDVPLITSSDYSINRQLARTPQKKIWNQIILDLKDAQTKLSSDYLDGTLSRTSPQRVRPTKWVATALLSRSYLFLQDWKNAEEQATSIINQKNLYQLESLNNVFTKNSKEAIWQLQPVVAEMNTQDAPVYVITPQYGPSVVYLSNQLLNSFEVGDERKKEWVDTASFEGVNYAFAYKYKLYTIGGDVNEFHTILRLGEQYLIRAEARAMQNNKIGALDDLKTIRERAGLKGITSDTQSSLISAIMHERQVELFTEWGHRWFDLKRKNLINTVMHEVTPLKGGTWNPNWEWFPIPFSDIQSNPNILQNQGY